MGLINIENISFRHLGTDSLILKDITLTIDQPGFHAFFGPSGVGKTTLAKLIAGEIKADSEDIYYTGNISFDKPQKVLYTYNLERFPGWMTIADNLKELQTNDIERNLTDKIIKAFGIESCLKQRFGCLSMGQQNRVNLARYLLSKFDILIMDESLANVDEKTKESILFVIKELFPSKCFLYISHHIVEVAKLCNQIWILRNSNKTPQIICTKGHDCQRSQTIDNIELEHTMLEIMHAY